MAVLAGGGRSEDEGEDGGDGGSTVCSITKLGVPRPVTLGARSQINEETHSSCDEQDPIR